MLVFKIQISRAFATFEILTFELLRLVADLQQLSGMEESAENAACNYHNVKRLTLWTTEF